METHYPIIHAATIVQIVPAAGPLADGDGNIYAGYALCEFDLEWADGLRKVGRDILPFYTDGGVRCAPITDDSYYLVNALGDHRPPFASYPELQDA